MNIEEQVAELESLISTNYKQQENMGKQLEALEAKRNELLVQMIKDRRLLSEYTWVANSYTNIRLTAKEKGKHDEITKLGGSWYHYSIPLDEPGCSVRSDDHELSISFDDTVNIGDFIKRYGLNVDFSRLEDRAKKLRVELEQIEEMMKLL